ncbi:hypothetical protein ABEB36_009745 [Hypothenemus hampei]|uniref:Uncharacterized protein n=1 Tax=Hypothenemus hampei TaxID=57062 RepID=A0ABD1EJH1_HYPHA
MGKCDRWTILRIVEVIIVIACLIVKRITDDEARSLFLYLQKLSREWSLLSNVTWDRIGSSVADATYGGYTIITLALLFGKLFGELPTRRRVVELTFLGVGAVHFIVLGSLELASIDSVPHDLVDNAAILGTLSVITGALFLLDMGAPKGKKPAPVSVPVKTEEKKSPQPVPSDNSENKDTPKRNGLNNNNNDTINKSEHRVIDIEKQTVVPERTLVRAEIVRSSDKRKNKKDTKNQGIRNGSVHHRQPTQTTPIQSPKNYVHSDPVTKGYKQMSNEDVEIPNKYGIYGKDAIDYVTDTDETASIPAQTKKPAMRMHSPVWSNVHKGSRAITTNYGVVKYR